MTRALLALCCLSTTSWALAQPSPVATPTLQTRVPKVLLLGIDGIRADALFASRGQNLTNLVSTSRWTDVGQASQYTVSGPGWSTVLTGVWPDRHGVVDNSFNGRRYDLYPHFFQRLRQLRPGIKLAHYTTWEPLDTIILGSFSVDYRLYVPYTQNGDAVMINSAVSVLRDTPVDVAFVYLSDVDVAGHNFGFHPGSPEYLTEILDNDQQVGRLINAIQSRTGYANEDWMILLVTDHGGTIDGAHGRDEPAHREILFSVQTDQGSAAKMVETVNQADVVPTVFAHLGLNPPRSWNWDGLPVGLGTPPPANGVNLIRNGGAEAADGYSGYTPNAGIPGWTDLGAATVVRYGSSGFPSAGSPGPADRGQSFFCGGSAAAGRTTTIRQRIDLSGRRADIRRGVVGFSFSGWLGGRGSDRDLATATVRFLDVNGGELATSQLGPVNRATRGNVTGLWLRESTGAVPQQTHSVEVKVVFEAGSGDNDGYADSLSFRLTDLTRNPL